MNEEISNPNTIKEMLVEDMKRGKPAVERSSRWETVRKNHLKENPTCAACGNTEGVQVHHMRPFHIYPELELDPTNFITLCENDKDGLNNNKDNHHLHLGHHGDWKNFNDKVLDEVNDYRLNESKLGKLTGYDTKNVKKIIIG